MVFLQIASNWSAMQFRTCVARHHGIFPRKINGRRQARVARCDKRATSGKCVTPRMQLAGWAQMFETIKRRPIQANIQTDGRVFSTENLRDHKQVAVTTRGETMKTTKSPFHVGGKWTWEAHQLCCTKALEETTVAHTVALDHLEGMALT
jgi:hypothetical protein